MTRLSRAIATISGVMLASELISWMRAACVTNRITSRKFPPVMRSTAAIDSGSVNAPATSASTSRSTCVKRMALIEFRGDGGRSHDQSRDKGAKESFAPAPGVVHELEEAEIQRQLLLRDAPVWPQPGA